MTFVKKAVLLASVAFSLACVSSQDARGGTSGVLLAQMKPADAVDSGGTSAKDKRRDEEGGGKRQDKPTGGGKGTGGQPSAGSPQGKQPSAGSGQGATKQPSGASGKGDPGQDSPSSKSKPSQGSSTGKSSSSRDGSRASLSAGGSSQSKQPSTGSQPSTGGGKSAGSQGTTKQPSGGGKGTGGQPSTGGGKGAGDGMPQDRQRPGGRGSPPLADRPDGSHGPDRPPRSHGYAGRGGRWKNYLSLSLPVAITKRDYGGEGSFDGVGGGVGFSLHKVDTESCFAMLIRMGLTLTNGEFSDSFEDSFAGTQDVSLGDVSSVYSYFRFGIGGAIDAGGSDRFVLIPTAGVGVSYTTMSADVSVQQAYPMGVIEDSYEGTGGEVTADIFADVTAVFMFTGSFGLSLSCELSVSALGTGSFDDHSYTLHIPSLTLTPMASLCFRL